jgi:general L-amino acid transport system substrate-binding protein
VAQAGEQSAGWALFADDFSREPLAPAWRAGDAQWGDVVRWVINATFVAEAYGITSENIDEMIADESLPAEAKRLLGLEGELHTYLGLDAEWGQNVIRAVGNYGEIFDRNLGSLGLQREANALYTDGGLIYPLPYR